MALPEIANPTIAQLHNIINVNIANDVAGGIDPTDDRAVRNSIVNFLNNLNPSTLRNRGWFSGLNIGSMTIGASLTVHGNITSAIVQANDNPAGYTVIRCVMANSMDDTNYRVDTAIQSESSLNNDARTIREVFSPVTLNSFDIAIRRSSAGTQSLKMHIDVIQLS